MTFDFDGVNKRITLVSEAIELYSPAFRAICNDFTEQRFDRNYLNPA